MTDATDQPPGIPAVIDPYALGESYPAQQGEFLGRILDPVRAKALHEANRYIIVNGTEGEDPVGEVIAIAERFEAYLDPEVE